MTETCAESVAAICSCCEGKPDRAFICFASPEPRCLGAAQRFHEYRAGVLCIMRVTDEENPARECNVGKLHEYCAACGPVVECPTRHGDPLAGLSMLLDAVTSSGEEEGTVTVDISTFPRNSLLLTLRALMNVVPPRDLRLVYTEPGEYNLQAHLPLSYGLRQIAAVPTFAAPYRAEEELVLVIFLGFERDRVLGLWQSVAPHRTYVVIADPPYRAEWQGISEHINAAILAGLPTENVKRVDPRNPAATCDLLQTLLVDQCESPGDNYYIAPFGTKPQTVGICCFCQEYPKAASVVYAAPVANNLDYIAQGIGPTWIVPMPTME